MEIFKGYICGKNIQSIHRRIRVVVLYSAFTTVGSSIQPHHPGVPPPPPPLPPALLYPVLPTLWCESASHAKKRLLFN